MGEMTRREWLWLNAAAVVAAGLPLRSWGQGAAKAPSVLRNQPDGVAKRLRMNDRALDALASDFAAMLAEGLHPGAQLAIFRDGELAVELAGGIDGPPGNPVTHETLFQIRSTTKALTTMVMLMLHDRGRFSFDDPVATYWPEFAANGKGAITIAQIMSHRAGIPDGPMIGPDQLGDREAVAKAVAAMTPIWPPGSANGYHAATIGWVCDELVWRWEGRDVADILKAELLAPIGAGDVYLGLPSSEFPRMAKMVVSERVRGRQDTRARFSDFLNTYDGIKLSLSWVGGVASARGLAWVMNVLAAEGTFGGHTFFSKATQKLASTPTNDAGVEDLRLKFPVRWGLGFILGLTPDVYGTPPHPRAVGHAGGGAPVGWADPDRGIAVAFTCNRMLSAGSWDRYKRVGDAVYRTLA